MASSRTLNGIGNNSAINFALLKQNNLSDLTNVPNARTNLGLVGNLSAGGNISLSDYNGTQNRTISAIGTIDSTPNTLVAYNARGQIDIRGVNGTGYGISNATNTGFFNEKNVFINTDTMTINSTNTFCGIKLKNSVSTFFLDAARTNGYGKAFLPALAFMLWCENVGDYVYYCDGQTGDFTTRGNITANGNVIATSIITPSITTSGTSISLNSKNLTSVGNITANNVSIGGAIDSTKKLRVEGDAQIIGTIFANSFKSASFEFVGTDNYVNFRIDQDSIAYADQFIAEKSMSTNVIKPIDDGASIIFKNWIDMNTATLDPTGNFTSIGNITSSGGSIQTNTITSTGSSISFNNKRLTNIANVSKQLWAFTNTVANTASVLTSIPTNSQAVMNLTTATLFTFRTSIAFTYNGEATLRLSYVRQILGISSGLYIILGLYSSNGSTIISASQSSVYNNAGPTSDSVSITLSGLTIGESYMIALMDKASASGMQFYLFSPEISLFY